MLFSRDSRVLRHKDKNKFEINKEILLLLFIPYSKLTFLALSLSSLRILGTAIMKYEELVSILSQARIGKYFRVAKGNKQRTLQLYHHNLKLSQRLFGVIGMFEIALRNAIHNHYSQQFNDKDWIVNSTAPGKLLAYDAKEIAEAQNEYIKKGIYSADKMVATFNFGFWTYLFTKNNYRIGSKTLLQIFPNKKKGLTQKDVYNDLCAIRELRNRIAHHEPICFDKSKNLSTQYVVKHYDLIKTYFTYMGYDANKLLKIVEKPDSVIKEIDKL